MSLNKHTLFKLARNSEVSVKVSLSVHIFPTIIVYYLELRSSSFVLHNDSGVS